MVTGLGFEPKPLPSKGSMQPLQQSRDNGDMYGIRTRDNYRDRVAH